MFRLLGILIATMGLTACSSGISNQGAGAAGTNCSRVELTCTMTISVESISIDAFASDTDFDGFPDELVESDLATLTIEINDPLGTWSNTFQGVTWQTYDISYNSGQGGAPNLGTRRFTGTFSITLSNSTGSGSVTIPIVDLVTKAEFSKQASGSTVYPYVVTVRATGRDFATGQEVVVVARINLELGDFVQSVPEPPDEEPPVEESP